MKLKLTLGNDGRVKIIDFENPGEEGGEVGAGGEAETQFKYPAPKSFWSIPWMPPWGGALGGAVKTAQPWSQMMIKIIQALANR